MRATSRLLCALMLLVACSKEHPGTRGKGPSITRMVPANTPYAFVVLEPAPNSYIEKAMRAAGPAFDKLMSDTQRDHAPPGARLLLALGDELKGNMTPEGLDKLGFGTHMKVAVYGLGLFPAARFEVKDPAAVQGLLARVVQKSGVPVSEGKLGSQAYWTFHEDGMSVVFTVAGPDLVLLLAPDAAVADLVPQLLGEPPAENLSEAGTLEAIQTKYGVKPYGLFLLDLARGSQLLLDENSPTRRALAAAGGHLPPISDVCKQEITALVDNAPRLAGGIDLTSENETGGTFVWEMKPMWAKALVSLRSPVPGLGEPVPGALLQFGAGVDVARTIDLVKTVAAAIQLRPFKCDALSGLNESAAKLSKEMEQPAPEWVRSLKGFNLVVKQMQAIFPPDAQGYLVLSSTNPKGLIDMARDEIPALAAVRVTNDGKPAMVPGGAIPFVNDLAVMWKGDNLALSMGKGEESEAGLILGAQASDKGPLLVVTYDLGRISRLIGSAGGKQMDNLGMYGPISSSIYADDRGLVWKFRTFLK